MKIAQSIVVVAAAAIAITAIPATADAQADPHTGTWVLNVAKSKYTLGPPNTSGPLAARLRGREH